MKYRVEKPSFIANRHVSAGEIIELDPKTVHREDTHLVPINESKPKPVDPPKPTILPETKPFILPSDKPN